MSIFRAALVLAVGALAAGCGSGSGTTAEPAPIASIRATTSTPPKQAPKTPTATSKTKAPTTTTTTTTKEVVEYRTIPFKKKTVTDDSLPKGEKRIRTTGINGTRRLTYRVTYVNGVQTAKRLVRNEVAKQPRTQITVVGTKVEQPQQSSGCDPNYTPCVPIASDVDCAGGGGNGPEYVDGPVTVIGTDIYRLDADHDGIGCED